MVFLENPETTTSYQSWRDLTGCCCVLVQARTGSGLKKNSTIFHRMAYSQTDLEPYRIIVVDPPDTRVTFTENGPGTRDHDNDEPLKNAEKYIIASASSEHEILHHWEIIRRNFKIPFCGSVSAQYTAQQAAAVDKNDDSVSNKNFKRDAVKERRLASAILPNWANFVKSPAARSVANRQQQQQAPSSSSSPCSIRTSAAAPPQQQQQQQQTPQRQTQQQHQPSSLPQTVSSPTTMPTNSNNNNTNNENNNNKPRVIDTSNFSIEENPIINREFSVIKELPTIERSLAQACLRIQPDRLMGFVYIIAITGCYVYARMTETSALFDVTILVLFLWHCRVNKSSSSNNNNNNNSHHNVEKALEREREVDALGGLGRLINIFSLSHPPSAVAFWVIVHFYCSTYYPDLLPNGILPFVQGMTLPCGVAALLLAPHIGPVVRPASAEEFDTDESPMATTTTSSMNGENQVQQHQQQGNNNSPSPVRSGSATNNNPLNEVAGSPVQQHQQQNNKSAAQPTNQSMTNTNNASFNASGSLSLTTSFGPGNASFARSPMPATTRRCLQLWKSGGQWKLAKERSGVLYRTKPVPWCKPLAIWLTTTIPNARAVDVEAVLSDDVDGSNKNSFAFQFDKMMDHRFRAKVLQLEPWFEHVWCTRFKTPIFTVKPRELSTKVAPVFYLTPEQQKRWGIESDTGVVYTFCGFTDPHETVPRESKYERGDMHCYGMIAIENGGGVILHQILSMDLGGYLPGWIVNLTNDEQIDRVAMIRDLCMKYRSNSKLKLQMGPRRPLQCYTTNPDAYRMMNLNPDSEEDRKLVAEKYAVDNNHLFGGATAPAGNALGTTPNDNNNSNQVDNKKQQQQKSSSSGNNDKNQKHPVHEKGEPMPSAVKKALKLLNENAHEWKLIKTEDGIEYSTRPSPFCNKVAVKLHITFDKSTGIRAEDVYSVMHDDPKGTAGKACNGFKFDRLLSERICLKYVSESLQHWRTCYKSPVWGVKARDMCTILNTDFLDPIEASQDWGIKEASHCDPEKGGEVFMIAGEDNGKHVPEDSNFNRGAVHVYFILAVDRPDGTCDMTTVLSVDPQGYIPASLVDATNLEQIEKVKFQREMFKEEVQKRRQRERRKKEQQEQQQQNNNNNSNNQNSNNNNKEANNKPLPATIKKVMKLYKEVDWKDVDKKKDVIFRDAPSPYCDKKSTYFETFVPKANVDDVQAIVNDDPEGTNPNANAYTYDRLLSKRILVKKEADEESGSEYVYWRTLFKSPVWGVGARDFVFRSNTLVISSKEKQREMGFESNLDDGKVFCFSSDDYSEKHPKDSSYTRGALHTYILMAVEFKRESDGVKGVKLYQIGSFDPQGMIPTKVIDATNGEQIEKLVIMRKLMEEHAEKNGRS